VVKIFRVHGDNIIECERIVDYLFAGIDVIVISREFVSLSCICVNVVFGFNSVEHRWKIEMFPGFNKANRRRWKGDIFDSLRDNGGFLDETPDALVTQINNDKETILFAVEFCSALQAGNQAWQRSGRAYSVGRSGCPYIYIVDFVKYELDSTTRERKALRFPNAAVPYSFISFSKYTANFVVQSYVRAEEFQPSYDSKLANFDESIFAEKDLAEYMLLKMLNMNTSEIEMRILDKNSKMVEWLSTGNNKKRSFDNNDWKSIYETKATSITHSLDENRFKFSKSIAAKSITGKNREFTELVKLNSVGYASVDLPFGLIPADKRQDFAIGLSKLYPVDDELFKKIAKPESTLVICMVKGFKPRGDDNRPDRGILPLIAMLSSENTEVVTFIYGPIIKSNYKLLVESPTELARRNGFWRVFMSLSDYFVVDAPLLDKSKNSLEQIEQVIDNQETKKSYIAQKPQGDFSREPISTTSNSYHEDDVDTVIHAIFKHIIDKGCFEGMCNPPGGDWSGLSVILNNTEYRWLSLPRVSPDCKRPDHLIELFDVQNKPILLVVESKDRKQDLESDIGLQLKGYLDFLFSFRA